MPTLGVSVFDKGSGQTVIMPVGYDGRDYTVQSDRLLPANSGTPLVTQAMLPSTEPVRRRKSKHRPPTEVGMCGHDDRAAGPRLTRPTNGVPTD